MKVLLAFFLLCSFFNGDLFAQTDSSAYITQRNKINKLLDTRSDKFGQYDISLKKRSGIFGLKTKKDMQFSNDILTQIVLTDNHIFSELKILLDYKDFEKVEVETKAKEVESYIGNYQKTIMRLQKENERLRTGHEQKDKKNERLFLYLCLSLIVLIVLTLYLFKLKKLPKTDI